MLDEEAGSQSALAVAWFPPNEVIPVFEARALEEKGIVHWNWIFAFVVHNVADVHADYTAVLKHPVTFEKDELHLLQVVVEIFKAARTFAAASNVKIRRICQDELHGIVGQFGHPARIPDYNEVGLFHAHNCRAGGSL